MTDKDDMPFEAAMQELESIISALERGELPLEQAVEKYRRAEHLRKVCRRKLEEAELVVRTAVKDTEGERLESFPTESAE
jgi:exodeoxyribonuclease VII small subunit